MGIAAVTKHLIYIRMIYQRHVATWARGHISALSAKHEAVAAPPIEIQYGLLLTGKGRVQGGLQRSAENGVVAHAQFSAHIHHLNRGQRQFRDKLGAVARSSASNARGQRKELIIALMRAVV